MTPTDFFSPAAGFDDALEIWLACHERVQRFCALMARLNQHLAIHGADTDAQITANSIRRYFNEAAPRHHEDEEIDLFPSLQARMPADKYAALAPTLASIEEDHQIAAGIWSELNATLVRIEAGEKILLNPALLDRWTGLYQHHIVAEEQVVMPHLKRHLSKADWQRIGRSMAARRGVAWPDPDPATFRQSILPIKAAKS
ncbi:MAG: hemerythrin domain-containing protein [Burkholderiaceae bacterium]